MDFSRPLTDRHEICTQVWCGVKAKKLLKLIFWQQWPLPLALIVWGVASLKFCGDWKYASNYGKLAYCRLGNARRAALVANLLDKCRALI